MAESKAQFNWVDPLLLEQQLTEDERMVRDTPLHTATKS
jgi:glutaryl-CoA dehydrogenase